MTGLCMTGVVFVVLVAKMFPLLALGASISSLLSHCVVLQWSEVSLGDKYRHLVTL